MSGCPYGRCGLESGLGVCLCKFGLLPPPSDHQGDAGFNPTCPCPDCRYVRNSQALVDEDSS